MRCKEHEELELIVLTSVAPLGDLIDKPSRPSTLYKVPPVKICSLHSNASPAILRKAYIVCSCIIIITT